MSVTQVEQTLQLVPSVDVDPLALSDEDVKELLIQLATYIRTPGFDSAVFANTFKSWPTELQAQATRIVCTRGLDNTDPFYLFWLRPASVNIALGINYSTVAQENANENV